MGNILQGNLGASYFTHRPVTEAILERLPATLELSIAATLISYLIGIPLGVYAGLNRGGKIDHGIRFFTSMLNAVPHWWLGLICIIFIANIKLATGVLILPIGGIQTIGKEGFDPLDRLWHLILPAVMLGTAGWVGFSRYMRSETLEVLGQDYVRTAHAKGLAQRVVTFRHVLGNALIPVVTISGGLFVGLVSGSVVYENIFSWPGMGRLLFDATLKKDYPISIGVVFVFTILAVLGRLVADIAYGWVDPRIRYD
jgi:peptide/nickel transport system permease protein